MRKICTTILLLATIDYAYTQSQASVNVLQPGSSWGLHLLLFLTAGLVFFYWHKYKKHQQLITHLQEANTRLTINAQTAITQEKEKMQAALDLKNQQLTSHSLHILQKNQALKELRGVVKQIRLLRTFKETKKMLGQLDNLANFGLHLDKDWENFQEVFEQLHPDFYAYMAQQFPTLSKSDLHLCALLKLNLSTREVADLLGITLESLKVKRHRLRQKLNLRPEEKLTEYIIALACV